MQKHFWTTSSPLPRTYYSGRRVWHIGFKNIQRLLITQISSKMLLSDEESCSLNEDEGGPFSLEKDELNLFFAEIVQTLVPENILISCRVFGYPKRFWEPANRFIHLSRNKLKLREVFTRYGIDPDSTPDYIFISNDPNAHKRETLKQFANSLDRYIKTKSQNGAYKTLELVSHTYEPVIWALDGFLFMVTKCESRTDVKSKLANVAYKFGVELPKYDFLLT